MNDFTCAFIFRNPECSDRLRSKLGISDVLILNDYFDETTAKFLAKIIMQMSLDANGNVFVVLR